MGICFIQHTSCNLLVGTYGCKVRQCVLHICAVEGDRWTIPTVIIAWCLLFLSECHGELIEDNITLRLLFAQAFCSEI